MGVLDWFNPKEKDTTTFEISNDDGDQIVFTVPTRGSNRIRRQLREARLARDSDNRYSRVRTDEFIAKRDSSELRWWAQRDVDPNEDREWQGDHEHACVEDDDDQEGTDWAVDDEESEQTALRFWPRW
ncbi:MAG: hypothetical protein AAF959_14190 [Cyanobacteria bacterium P01_D01_bin.56]